MAPIPRVQPINTCTLLPLRGACWAMDSPLSQICKPNKYFFVVNADACTRVTGIRGDPNFEAFVKSLETAPTSGLGKDAEYALWINTYNALAIKMVCDNPCSKKLLGLKKTKIAGIRGID